jgi:phosphatidylglycerophosphatase A
MKFSEKNTAIDSRSVWTNPIHFIACGFGIGLSPIMPGTLGTLLGVLFYLILLQFSFPMYLFLVLLMNIAGVYLCGRFNRDLKTQDHPAAVWDEIATFPIVMIAIPFTWYYLLLGFVLFRFFDIVKPFPISYLDKHVHGGFGVMLDDIVAALFSWVILFITMSLTFHQPLPY